MSEPQANDDRERMQYELTKELDKLPGFGPTRSKAAADAVLQSNLIKVQDAEVKAKDAKETRGNQIIVAMIAAVALLTAAVINGSFSIVTNRPKPPPGIDSELLNKILSFPEKLHQANEQLRANEQEIKQLKAAWKRAEEKAAAGDARAKDALDEARRSGDTSKLQTLLVHEAERLNAQGDTDGFLALCREIATVAFLRGDIVEADSRVQTVLHAKRNDLSAMNIRGRIHSLRGQYDDAKRCYESILELSANDKLWQAIALGNLGVIYGTLGEPDRANEMFHKSLAIDEKLGRLGGMATSYGNLGIIYQMRGKLDRAEEMYRNALAIGEKLGNQDGIAEQYGNLGLVYRMRGDLDRAKEMFQKSLDIEEKLDQQVGMAINYDNLGLIYQLRGELDRAEELHRKALGINERLGNQEGIAVSYDNLGLMYRTRGELDTAEQMHRKSLDIVMKFGHREGMASNYGNLGEIYRLRGELDTAKEMYVKALAIAAECNLSEEMANQNANLGTIAKAHGELEQARELWTKARDLFAKIGMPHRVKEMQASLDGLSQGGATE